MATALRNGRKNASPGSSSGKPHASSRSNQNVVATHTRRKAEKLLVESLKACYPQWVEEGLVRKPR